MTIYRTYRDRVKSFSKVMLLKKVSRKFEGWRVSSMHTNRLNFAFFFKYQFYDEMRIFVPSLKPTAKLKKVGTAKKAVLAIFCSL